MAMVVKLEEKLWETADILRGNVSSSDYKEIADSHKLEEQIKNNLKKIGYKR